MERVQNNDILQFSTSISCFQIVFSFLIQLSSQHSKVGSDLQDISVQLEHERFGLEISFSLSIYGAFYDYKVFQMGVRIMNFENLLARIIFGLWGLVPLS